MKTEGLRYSNHSNQDDRCSEYPAKSVTTYEPQLKIQLPLCYTERLDTGAGVSRMLHP